MSPTITPSKPDLILQPKVASPTTNNNSAFGDFVQETLALTKRLFIQLQRRPSTLIAGIIQPVMWLVLFGALFQNAPQGLFDGLSYGKFIGSGIIVFTVFVGALNAGLPVMLTENWFLKPLTCCTTCLKISIVLPQQFT
jgi:ABC-2 type transport system permease protein